MRGLGPHTKHPNKMKASIEKTSGPFGRERKQVRTFADRDLMHRYLNGPNGYGWTEHKLGLKAGTYAYAGGQWLNVKKCDSSLLAHI